MSSAVLGAPLTERQREILRLGAMGYGNGEIASKLHIAPNTVRVHLSNAYDRLGVRSRAEAWRLLGWLKVPA